MNQMWFLINPYPDLHFHHLGLVCRFDSELSTVQEDVQREKTLREKLAREKDMLTSDVFSLRQQLEVLVLAFDTWCNHFQLSNKLENLSFLFILTPPCLSYRTKTWRCAPSTSKWTSWRRSCRISTPRNPRTRLHWPRSTLIQLESLRCFLVWICLFIHLLFAP